MGVGYTSGSNGSIPIYRYKLPTDYMYLISVLSEVIATCDKSNVPTVDTYTYREYLRVKLSPPIKGYVIKDINIATREGAIESIISSTGGLSYDELLGDNYSGNVTPSLSRNDSYTDRYFSTVDADSPTADANEFFLVKNYTEEELAVDTADKFWPFNSATIGQGGGYSEVSVYNGAFMEIIWVNPNDSTQTANTIYNEGPVTSYIDIKKYNVNTEETGNLRQLRTNCKFVQQDDIYKLLDDPFNCTKASGILYTMQETFIDLYTLKSFIPNSILIKYIRRPATMSYNRGIGCELPEHTHHEIVEMAVKSILEGFESPRYQTQSGEVLESE
jgi:hypothetical protein